MEHLFPCSLFKSASASQTQTNSPCLYCCNFSSTRLQTDPGLMLTAVRPCASSALGVLCWGISGLQRPVSVGCTTARKQRLSHETSPSEASSLLIYFGQSFCLFNISNYDHCWKQKKKKGLRRIFLVLFCLVSN